MVSTIRRTGEMLRAPPGAFGAVTNAHHIRIGGPWDSTFEPKFNAADSEIGEVISWLLTLEATTTDPNGPRLKRILAQSLPPARQSELARIVSSLIARSPRTRDEIKRNTQYWRERMGMADPRPEDHLIAMNQRGLYDAYCKRIEGSGRWAVLYSDSKEFIFGDGFLHNFPASSDGMISGRKCVLPLTPTIAVVYMLPSRHPSEPKLVTIRLDDDEVQFFNDALQAYASEFLFFRSQIPTLIPAFTKGAHRQFKYHKHAWLEELLDDLSQYHLWGPGGAPGRSEACFAKGLEMDEWLESFAGERKSED